MLSPQYPDQRCPSPATLSLSKFRAPRGTAKSCNYFCVKGAREIASHFNVDFWTDIVLQQSHENYVVRQALVSLSSLHLECATATINEPRRNKPEALAQYGKAIHALRKRIAKPDRDTIKAALTCCVLFYCFEAALGDSGSAMRHLDAGLDLLSTHCRGRKFDDDDHMGALSRVFESLDLQATIFDDARVPRIRLSFEVGGDEKAFRDLNEAYGAFKRLQNALFHFLTAHLPFKFCGKESLPIHVVEEKSLLEDQICVWWARFEKTDFTKSADKSEHLGARLLLIQWHVSKMLVDANYPINDGIFGSSPNPRAEKVLDMVEELSHYSQGRDTIPGHRKVSERRELPSGIADVGPLNARAEKVLDMAEDLRHSSQGKETSRIQGTFGERRTFSSESGVVGPLFALAAKCSDEVVCNRALELLTTSQRREGFYDSGNMAEIIHQFRAARDQKKVNDLKQVPMMNVSALSLETFVEQEADSVVGGMRRLADSLGSGPRCYKSTITQARLRIEEREHKEQDTLSEAVPCGVGAVGEANPLVLDPDVVRRDVGVPDFAQRHTTSAV